MATRAHPSLLNASAQAGSDGLGRVLAIVAGAALASGILIFLLLGSPAMAAGFVGAIAAVGALFLIARRGDAPAMVQSSVHDWALTRAAIESET